MELPLYIPQHSVSTVGNQSRHSVATLIPVCVHVRKSRALINGVFLSTGRPRHALVLPHAVKKTLDAHTGFQRVPTHSEFILFFMKNNYIQISLFPFLALTKKSTPQKAIYF